MVRLPHGHVSVGFVPLVCALLADPSLYLRGGDGISNAAQRLLRFKLSEFGMARALGEVTQDEQVKVVAAYALETRFLRTIFHVPIPLAFRGIIFSFIGWLQSLLTLPHIFPPGGSQS